MNKKSKGKLEGAQTISASVVIESNVMLSSRLILENDVYIEKGVIFSESSATPTVVRERARIGAGSIIAPGVEIGAGSHVQQGSVVFQSVPANAVV